MSAAQWRLEISPGEMGGRLCLGTIDRVVVDYSYTHSGVMGFPSIFNSGVMNENKEEGFDL